jgi:predicted Zn-dependent peptidase
MHQKDILVNGLRVITFPMPEVKSANILILAGAGSRYESKETSGISHFAEHMFFKGTTKRPTTFDISSTVDGIGGDFNAFTSKEYTGFYIKVASNHLPLALEVLSDMVLNSKFDTEEINRERGVILEEIRMYKDTPMRYVGTIFESLLYDGNPLGWDIAGNEGSVRGIDRGSFINYFKSFYVPNNIVVGVAGDIKEEEIKLLIDGHFGSLDRGDVPMFEKVSLSQSQPRIKVHFKETEQAHLALGVPAYPIDHPNHYSLMVLNNILGGVMSSRLFISLRERRGLAYYVRSSVDEYLDTGNLMVQAGVELSKVEEAIKLIIAEFVRIASEAVPELELSKAKENLKGKLILELEDSKEVSLIYSLHELLEKKVRTPEEIITGINKVTASDVLKVGKDIFKQEMLNLAIIGPYKNEDSYLRLLKF